MDEIEKLTRQLITVTFPVDEKGYTGRECPNTDCEGYFKIVFGTGLPGSCSCHCPYCGHVAEHDQFFTQDQLKYVQTYAANIAMKALMKDMKAMEFDHKPRGAFGIGFSLKFKGSSTPIHRYREEQLETEVVCDHCTLNYAIYSRFGFCPDCGKPNTPQILTKNFEVIGKMLCMTESAEPELAEYLIGNGLEDAVSAFDGFGREICRIHAGTATAPNKAQNVSFQNLQRAQKRLNDLFSFDIAMEVTSDEWETACKCFQKRHLLAHKMGVVDEDYVRETNDQAAIVGRKILITASEVTCLIQVLEKIGQCIARQLSATG